MTGANTIQSHNVKLQLSFIHLPNSRLSLLNRFPVQQRIHHHHHQGMMMLLIYHIMHNLTAVMMKMMMMMMKSVRPLPSHTRFVPRALIQMTMIIWVCLVIIIVMEATRMLKRSKKEERRPLMLRDHHHHRRLTFNLKIIIMMKKMVEVKISHEKKAPRVKEFGVLTKPPKPRNRMMMMLLMKSHQHLKKYRKKVVFQRNHYHQLLKQLYLSDWKNSIVHAP